MPHLSPISPKKMMKFLEKEGFVCIRTKGSHHYFLNKEDGRTTVIPVHSNRDIGVGLLQPILRDINLTAKGFLKKLKD